MRIRRETKKLSIGRKGKRFHNEKKKKTYILNENKNHVNKKRDKKLSIGRKGKRFHNEKKKENI